MQSSYGGSSPNRGGPPSGDILIRLPEGTGELAVARDDPVRRTLGMAQVAGGEAVHGIVFTWFHGADAGSPVGDGGEVAEFRTNSATFGAVPLHDEMVQLFTNWPVKHSPRDPVVALTMRTALRHIGDGIQWAGLDEESPGTGKRLAGAHSLRHSAARHWLMVGRVPLNVVSSLLGHANVQVTLRIYLPIVGSTYSMAEVP